MDHQWEKQFWVEYTLGSLMGPIPFNSLTNDVGEGLLYSPEYMTRANLSNFCVSSNMNVYMPTKDLFKTYMALLGSAPAIDKNRFNRGCWSQMEGKSTLAPVPSVAISGE